MGCMKQPRLLFTDFFHKFCPWQIGLGSLLVIVAIGLVDYFITANLGMSIFYVLPIASLTWYVQSRLGYLAGIASAFLWGLAEARRFPEGFHPFLMGWNTLVRLSFFILIVFLLVELKSAYQQERRLAQTDPLTALLNRRAFTEILEREIQRSQRYGFAFTLAYLDIDNFKQVNDRLGHAEGDRLLQKVADILTQGYRAGDYHARLGGDEFAILLAQTDQAQATPALQRLMAGFASLKAPIPSIGFSIGAVTFQETLPESAEKALSAADKVMYAAKSRGKNQLIQAKYPLPQPSAD